MACEYNVMDFRVDQIDHVELVVPDRHAAARWYQQVLGLRVIEEFKSWADDPNGPLMIGTPHAGTRLALFAGQPTGSKEGVGFHLVAFRVSGEMFLRFVSRLDELQLIDNDGNPVAGKDVSDHKRACSLYFCDPWGNELELTSYERDFIVGALL